VAEKKRKRLERNRESARECRKRKKEKKLLLRQQLNLLEADNLQLRLKLQVGHESTKGDDKSAYITSRLESMLKEGASEVDVSKMIGELQERYSDYGRDRRSAIDFHVEQLKRCLQPTQTTRAILWLMSLASKFHDPLTGEINTPTTTGPSPMLHLWTSLLAEVKPTAAQRKIMVSYTTPTEEGGDPFADIKSVTTTCNSMLDRLVDIICNKNESLDTEMANIQTILSATQIAKFILWIDQNPACMQMLEALWPHITYVSTEPSHALSSRQGGAESRENLSSLQDSSDEDDSMSDEEKS